MRLSKHFTLSLHLNPKKVPSINKKNVDKISHQYSNRIMAYCVHKACTLCIKHAKGGKRS